MKKIKKRTEIRGLIEAAKIVSTIFRPMYYPLLGSAILLTMTPLSLLPLEYKALHLLTMMLFTITIPWLSTVMYMRLCHIVTVDLTKRHNKIVPYAIYIIFYTIYYYMMREASIPYPLVSVIIVALCIQIACTLISLVWKVSVHMAGAGAIIGALAAYGFILNFNPLPWLCTAIIVSGLVGTSRMILRQHNLSQLVIGLLIGFLCGFLGILYLTV